MRRNHTLRLVSLVVAGIGLIDAIYLTWVKLAHTQVFCGGYGGCETVASSPYAEIGGIPIALFGAGAYLVILVLLSLEGNSVFWKENSPLLIFGITLAGVLYSAYLTYLEIAVIHAICPYCVVSAVAMLTLFILGLLRLVQNMAETSPI